MYEGRARLIDLGGAVELPAPENTPYCGGYLCCPPELIRDCNLPYTPSKCHDRPPFVMMACLMAMSKYRWAFLLSATARCSRHGTCGPVERRLATHCSLSGRFLSHRQWTLILYQFLGDWTTHHQPARSSFPLSRQRERLPLLTAHHH